MNHRQRMQACLRGETTDRTPVAMWRHFPVDDQRAETIAAAHLHFQQTYDWDFLKITPASGYFLYDWGVEDAWNGHPHGTRDYTKRVVHKPEDWAALEAPAIHRGHLGEQLAALNRIVEAIGEHTPVIFTIFNPLSTAKKLCGDALLIEHLRKHPDELCHGLELITEANKEYVHAVINEIGADGIFFAVQHAQTSMLSEEEYHNFGRPYDLPVLQAAADGWLNVLHLHGEAVYFNHFLDYPVQVINWHDLETKPDLKTGQSQFPGAVCGGIRQETTLNLGTPEDVRAEARQAIAATDGRGFILGTGCVAPTTTPHGNLMAARRVVEE